MTDHVIGYVCSRGSCHVDFEFDEDYGVCAGKSVADIVLRFPADERGRSYVSAHDQEHYLAAALESIKERMRDE
jgi:hypothetical protein